MLVLLQVSKMPAGAPDLLTTKQSYCIRVSFQNFVDFVNTLRKHCSPNIVMNLIREFAIAAPFQDITFVKHSSFMTFAVFC